MRIRLLAAIVLLLISSLLTSCGGSSTANHDLCPTASRYLYYGNYLAGKYGRPREGEPAKALFTTYLQTITDLTNTAPSERKADAEAVRAAAEEVMKILRSRHFISSNLTEADSNKVQQLAAKVEPAGMRLTTWLKKTCGKTPGFGDRPTDAPTDVPPRA